MNDEVPAREVEVLDLCGNFCLFHVFVTFLLNSSIVVIWNYVNEDLMNHSSSFWLFTCALFAIVDAFLFLC